MLREQQAEAEELYEARAVRLESLLKEWNAKHASLRRRFSLETEGFRRDADNIGRCGVRVVAGKGDSFRRRCGGLARYAWVDPVEIFAVVFVNPVEANNPAARLSEGIVLLASTTVFICETGSVICAPS